MALNPKHCFWHGAGDVNPDVLAFHNAVITQNAGDEIISKIGRIVFCA